MPQSGKFITSSEEEQKERGHDSSGSKWGRNIAYHLGLFVVSCITSFFAIKIFRRIKKVDTKQKIDWVGDILLDSLDLDAILASIVGLTATMVSWLTTQENKKNEKTPASNVKSDLPSNAAEAETYNQGVSNHTQRLKQEKLTSSQPSQLPSR